MYVSYNDKLIREDFCVLFHFHKSCHHQHQNDPQHHHHQHHHGNHHHGNHRHPPHHRFGARWGKGLVGPTAILTLIFRGCNISTTLLQMAYNVITENIEYPKQQDHENNLKIYISEGYIFKNFRV